MSVAAWGYLPTATIRLDLGAPAEWGKRGTTSSPSFADADQAAAEDLRPTSRTSPTSEDLAGRRPGGPPKLRRRRTQAAARAAPTVKQSAPTPTPPRGGVNGARENMDGRRHHSPWGAMPRRLP